MHLSLSGTGGLCYDLHPIREQPPRSPCLLQVEVVWTGPQLVITPVPAPRREFRLISESSHSCVTVNPQSVLIMALMSAEGQHLLSRAHILAGLGILTCVGLFAARTFWTWYRLRHIKGPFSAAFSNYWLVRHVAAGVMHLDLAEVCEKYGAPRRD